MLDCLVDGALSMSQRDWADWTTLGAQVGAAVFTAAAAYAAARSARATRDTVNEMRADRLARTREEISDDLVKVAKALRRLAGVAPPTDPSTLSSDWESAVEGLRTSIAGSAWDLFEAEKVLRWEPGSDTPEDLQGRIRAARDEVVSFIEFERTLHR